MSLVCEAVKNSNDVAPNLSNQNELTKNSLDEEELDYEEEVDESRLDDKLNDDLEEGQISDGESEIKIKESALQDKKLEKDEGEIDSDDELEEGEVKEDSENEEKPEVKPEDNLVKPKVNARYDNRSIQSRLDLSRVGKTQINNFPWNSNTSNSRYTLQPIRRSNEDRYGRPRPALLPPPVLQPIPTESAWERGLKQARELISKASKRKEDEIDHDVSTKRYTLSVRGEPPRERSPHVDKRRRYSSQHSSSEDEVERRHRLAYDAAPWNNPDRSSHSSGQRSRSTLHLSSNRSAEMYRDPWRRSKSPTRPIDPAIRSRKPEYDSRHGESYKRERTRSDMNRSDSMSSLSSILSDSSDISSGRKLPYTRPTAYESRGKSTKEDVTNNERDHTKARMDRIPKKPNVSQSQSGERVSEAKSFDSWSDSLSSESDSSSVSFSNSDSETDDSGDEKIEKKPHKTTCKYSRERNTSSSTVNSTAQHKSKVPVDAKLPKSAPETQRKAPIKMTFMKKTTSIQKDKLFDDDPMNGEASDTDVIDKEFYVENKESVDKSDEDSLSRNSPPSNSKDPTKLHRREELLMKLKAVEEAIERKLNSKKD